MGRKVVDIIKRYRTCVGGEAREQEESKNAKVRASGELYEMLGE